MMARETEAALYRSCMMNREVSVGAVVVWEVFSSHRRMSCISVFGSEVDSVIERRIGVYGHNEWNRAGERKSPFRC